MNKKYKVIIINNQTQNSYSLTINTITKYLLFIFISMLIFFFSIGVFRFFKPHSNQAHINNLLASSNDYNALITTLYKNEIIDSTIFQSKQYDNNLIPSNTPVSGVVTQGIDLKHNGIDIATKLGSEVRAAQKGMVIFSNPLNDYGNTMIIAHPNNYYSVYSHLERCILKEREYVKANQIIGYVGQTGNTDGPHLHFEIWKNHHIIDPRQLIEEYKIKDVSIK